jgi:hypothetical protein
MNMVLEENEEPLAKTQDREGSGELPGKCELEVSSVCVTGVRQGCPCSPLFFKICLDA